MTQFTRFGVVGIGNTIIGVSAIFLAQFIFNAKPIVANLIGYLTGFGISYYLHRSWTFEHRAPARESVPRYAIVVLMSYLLNLAVLTMALAAGSEAYLAQLLGVASYIVASFLLCKFIAFS